MRRPPRILVAATAFVACWLTLMTGAVGAVEVQSGDIFVNDFDSDTLFHVDPTTGAKTHVSTGGVLGGGMAVERDGDIIVGDASGNLGEDEVIRIDPATGDQTVIAGFFGNTSDVALEPDGHILVADNVNGEIVRVDPATGAKSVLTVGRRTWVGVDVSPDGDIVGITPSAVLRVDPVTGEDEFVAGGQFDFAVFLDDVAIEPDGRILVLDAGSGPSRDAAYRIDPSTGAQEGVVDICCDVGGIAVETGGDILVTIADFRFVHFFGGEFDENGGDGLFRLDEDARDSTLLAGFVVPQDIAVARQLDKIAPAIQITEPPDGATYALDAAVVPDFSCVDDVDGSGIATCDATNINRFKLLNTSSEGAHDFTVTARDRAGNASSLTHTYFVDGTGPSVALNQEVSQPDPTDISPVEFRAVFSEPVIGFIGADVGLAGTSGGTTAVAREVEPFNGTRFAVRVSGMTQSGTVIASIPAGVATDSVGNVNLASTSVDNVVSFIANDPPVANDQIVTTLEDTPVGFALVASDPDGDSLAYTITAPPVNGSLSGMAPALTYTPDLNFNGSDSFGYEVDDGQGGSDTAAVSIEVTAVNDPPAVTAGPNVTVAEDSGPYSAGWATSIVAGPSNEAAQQINFITSNNHPALFSSPPALAANGTLSFTPAPNANGSSSVTVVLRDDGGTTNGGQDTSAQASFTIQVTPVNDPPTVQVVGGQCLGDRGDTATVQLEVGDVDNAPASLMISASSANQALLPNASLAVGEVGSSRTVTVTPVKNESGTAVVTFAVSDGTASTPLEITTTVGTGEADALTGTAGHDILLGLGGADSMDGLAEDDLLCGGQGDDRLTGGDGDDILDGGRGNDALSGGNEEDALFGNQGDDVLTGGPGADSFSGGAGADTATDFNATEGDVQDESIP